MSNMSGTGLPEDAIEDYKPGSLGLTKEDLLALITVLENGGLKP